MKDTTFTRQAYIARKRFLKQGTKIINHTNRMDKEDVVHVYIHTHIYNGILLSHKVKNRILPEFFIYNYNWELFIRRHHMRRKRYDTIRKIHLQHLFFKGSSEKGSFFSKKEKSIKIRKQI